MTSQPDRMSKVRSYPEPYPVHHCTDLHTVQTKCPNCNLEHRVAVPEPVTEAPVLTKQYMICACDSGCNYDLLVVASSPGVARGIWATYYDMEESEVEEFRIFQLPKHTNEEKALAWFKDDGGMRLITERA